MSIEPPEFQPGERERILEQMADDHETYETPLVLNELPGMWEQSDFMGGETDNQPEAASPTWCIHVLGADDVMPAEDRADAIAKAHRMNAMFIRDLEFDEAGIYPSMWAVPTSYEALGVKP